MPQCLGGSRKEPVNEEEEGEGERRGGRGRRRRSSSSSSSKTRVSVSLRFTCSERRHGSSGSKAFHGPGDKDSTC